MDYFHQTLTIVQILQGSDRLKKYLNLEGFLEKSLKINHALKSTGKSRIGREKPLKNSKYDQEIPQSQTADNPVAPRGRAAQPSRDTRKTN